MTNIKVGPFTMQDAEFERCEDTHDDVPVFEPRVYKPKPVQEITMTLHSVTHNGVTEYPVTFVELVTK